MILFNFAKNISEQPSAPYIDKARKYSKKHKKI